MTWAATPEAAYRPLRPASLAVQLVVLLVGEVLIYRSYSGYDALFHYSTHLLVGVLAAAVVLLGYLLLMGRPAPGQVLIVLGAHLVAMAPDVLFRGGIPHDAWMDVFLGHVASHFIPGGDETWLVLALLAYGAYLAVLAAWLRARRIETDSGRAPGVGIGGIGLVRPQADPRVTPLVAQHFGPPGPPQVLLLHGLGTSSAFWTPVADRLGEAGVRVLAPDALGFGASLGIGTDFGLAAQADALAALLPDRDTPVGVAAHSWGCAVAVTLARRHPDLVKAMVLVSPAAFSDRGEVRDRFARRSWLARATLDRSASAALVCGVMCLLRRPLVAVAPRAARQVPRAVARAGVLHTYPSYVQGLESLFSDDALLQAFRDPSHPLTVVLATDDDTVPTDSITSLPRSPAVDVIELPGDHLLPVTEPDLVATLLGERLSLLVR